MALLCGRPAMVAVMRRLPRWTTVVLLLLLLIGTGQRAGSLNYFRSYIAAAAIGISIYSAPATMRHLLRSGPAGYIAKVSYALYVFHGMLDATWLGSGDRLAKYLKRPLLFAATFAAAHVSTFYFERPLIAVGKRRGSRSTGGALAANRPEP